MYLLQPFPSLIKSYLSVFSYLSDCDTQQEVIKTIINAGEFHVSAKKSHLTKTEMGSEVQGTLKREMIYTNHELSTKSLSKNVL